MCWDYYTNFSASDTFKPASQQCHIAAILLDTDTADALTMPVLPYQVPSFYYYGSKLQTRQSQLCIAVVNVCAGPRSPYQLWADQAWTKLAISSQLQINS